MKYTLSITEELYEQLRREIFSVEGLEGAAFLLCGVSRSEKEYRFLARRVLPFKPEEYLVREPLRLSLDSAGYVRAAKVAAADGLAVIFVHSHPKGISEFSDQDNREEPKLMRFLEKRAPHTVHGSLVVSGPFDARGRAWVTGSWLPFERVRITGRRFRFLLREAGSVEPWFDRQVAAFGPELQSLLSHLHVGVVGCGGTGSAVAEQLRRLGVGKLSLFDHDDLDRSNVSRVYGSSVEQVGQNKAALLTEHLTAVGLPGLVVAHSESVLVQRVAKRLGECDVIFGCTDKEAPRAVLVQLALRYLIPVFDVGVKLNAKDGVVTDIVGRVTTLLPGAACLFCRGRITADAIAAEQLGLAERAQRVAEGYAPALATREPAVVTFTTSVAAQAVNEFLHRLSGFMGDERATTEVLFRFHAADVRRNSTPPSPDCFCTREQDWGRGDTRMFLELAWAD